MSKKLNNDQKHWAQNVQAQPIPSWVEAFDYAYKLGLERGREQEKATQSIISTFKRVVGLK